MEKFRWQVAFGVVRAGVREKRWFALANALFAAIVGYVLVGFPPGYVWIDKSYDLLFRFRGPVAAEDAVVIYIDESSRNYLKQPSKGSWDHGLHAEMITKLETAGARTIVFDVIFDQEPTKEMLPNSHLFAEAIRSHSNVVLAAELSETEDQLGTSRIPLFPLTHLQDAAAAVGLVSIPVFDDQTVRLYMRDVYPIGRAKESLGFLAASRTDEMVAERIKTQNIEQIWLNYYGPPEQFPSRSYKDVYESEDLSLLVRDKVVFFGSRPEAGMLDEKKDMFRTPFSGRSGALSPGVLVHVTACLNLLRGDWLHFMTAGNQALIVLATGLIFGFITTVLPPRTGLIIAAIGMIGISWHAVGMAGGASIWYAWLVPVGIQIPMSASIAVILNTFNLSRKVKVMEETIRRSRGASATGPEGALLADQVAATATATIPGDASTVTMSGAGHPDMTETMAGTIVGDTMAETFVGGFKIPDYKLIRKIGSGAFGEVWLATNMMQTYRAVKIIKAVGGKNASKFQREYEGIRRFDPVSRQHPNLVDILHLGMNEAGQYFYYVLEIADDIHNGQVIDPVRYVPRSLDAELANGKRYNLEENLRITADLTSSIQCLHKNGMIHRDIKPANIIFINEVAKMADIGLVTFVDEAKTFVGTFGYIPPEGPGTYQADLFSLGKVFYEMLTGLSKDKFPKLPDDLTAVADSKYVFQLLEIIRKSCEGDPQKRYPNADVMLEDIEDLRYRAKKEGIFEREKKTTP